MPFAHGGPLAVLLVMIDAAERSALIAQLPEPLRMARPGTMLALVRLAAG